jgi:hypothetical protein
MTRAPHQHDKKPRTARGLPRACQACGQSFRPKSSKAKFCGPACKQAQHRQKAQELQIVTQATHVAPVTIRSKLANEFNGVQAHSWKPRIAAESGWHIEGGELIFYPLPGTPPFTAKERRHLSRGHFRTHEAA